MSFDRDLRRKEKAKYDERYAEMEREAADWISEVLHEPVTLPTAAGGDLCDLLRDGVLLGRLCDAVEPGRVRVKRSAMPFVQMENVSQFLTFSNGTLGIPQHDLFQTVDLFERKNCMQVVQALHTFSRYAVQSGKLKGVDRFLGPKMSTSVSREFTKEQMAEAKNHVNTFQYGRFNGSTNVTRGARRDPDGKIH